MLKQIHTNTQQMLKLLSFCSAREGTLLLTRTVRSCITCEFSFTTDSIIWLNTSPLNDESHMKEFCGSVVLVIKNDSLGDLVFRKQFLSNARNRPWEILFFKPRDPIMVANSPWIGAGPGFDSQGCVTFFHNHKNYFPNLYWIHWANTWWSDSAKSQHHCHLLKLRSRIVFYRAPNIYCAGAGTAADCDKTTANISRWPLDVEMLMLMEITFLMVAMMLLLGEL